MKSMGSNIYVLNINFFLYSFGYININYYIPEKNGQNQGKINSLKSHQYSNSNKAVKATKNIKEKRQGEK